ncbi:MAG: hypothetical protein QF792_05135, partial [Phycisphaerae bacterium]|nr:hypothetical protein [Phycisphaerae bacterium]
MTAATLLAELSPMAYVVVGLLILMFLVFLGLFGPLFGLWLQAIAAHAGVGMFELIGMRLRK